MDLEELKESNNRVKKKVILRLTVIFTIIIALVWFIYTFIFNTPFVNNNSEVFDVERVEN